MPHIERNPVMGSKATRRAASKLMRAKDRLATARADHEAIGDLADGLADDLDVSDLVEQSKAKLEALRADHDGAEAALTVELIGEPDESALIHHGDRDVFAYLDDDDGSLHIGDLDDEDEGPRPDAR